ncbi:uncharacterized protein LOC107831480 [Nicotiana tabacum]|uniref:Probable ATP-dependent DNA helicase DDX11 isoform X1 n=1 Tax=Nicotiana tabacum TaxID=4097 RepID=A0A1S4DMT8_TOBAC|nr:PREDICTED: probable ATP-dependent DNA helicase DDX11 isoform X1 [Nicotiana tabacum]
MEERREFPAFPYEVYSIQLDFMNALYHSLNKGGVAMLESPTGTGKTLSIICSALQWLLDRKQQQKTQSGSTSNLGGKQEDYLGADDEPDWMRNFVINKDAKSPEKKTKEKRQLGFNKKIDRKGKREIVRDLITNEGGKEEDIEIEKVNNLMAKHEVEGMDEEEFLVEEYESEDENGGQSKRKGGGVSVNSSSEEEKNEDSMEDEEEEARPKIYFCSRTHSQLSQFVKELRKSKFAGEVKVVCLGSRKNFCINQEVLKLGNPTQINERCLELQKNRKKENSKISKTKNIGAVGRARRSKTSSGCPMLKNHKRGKEFRSEVSQQGPVDIEDLVQIGRDLKTCPYYGSRSLVHTADLVVLPYQSLLSKSSRESLGLSLKDSVVIIDEAHNLADSLVSMYDSKITLSQLELVHSHLESYFIRFRNLLGPGNRRYIQIIMVLTRAFLQALGSENCQSSFDPVYNAEGSKSGFDSSMSINEFLFAHNIDNINLFKLLRYIEESNIIHKVCGYGHKLALSEEVSALKNDDKVSHDESALSGFRALVNILLSLTNRDGDGRIIISRTRPKCPKQQGGYLKYVMLTGERIFSEVLNEAHAVILAGGTLQPIEETKERLFPWLPLDQLHLFSCGHIIPPENILPIVVSQGPSRHSFDFSYSARSSSIMIQELGLLVSNLVNVVPEGMVIFFSSFDYEGQVYDAWKELGIIGRIMKRKRIFREPRKSTDVEIVLKEYKETIEALSHSSSKQDPGSRNGAILLAIVGGKVSEGINFSNGMGRCIVMVGLPYPSPADIELMERIKHIEGFDTSSGKNTKFQSPRSWYSGDAQAGLDILKSCKHRGKQYYENLCMKAVNQSIGRAIRHINDYAAILLVDTRYTFDSSERSSSHSTNKLPLWIKSRLVSATKNYGELHKLLHQFFKFHKGKEDIE